MKKLLPYISVGVVCLVLGYTLPKVSNNDLPSDLSSRIVDSIGARQIVEFYGSPSGVEERLRYFRDDQSIRPINLPDLNAFIREKFDPDVSRPEDAIKDFIKLHNGWEQVVLSSPEDIPGFSPNQLDQDLSNLTLSPVKTVSDSETISVMYTWTQVGGVLRRYKFKTREGQGPVCCSCITIQTRVGEFKLLE